MRILICGDRDWTNDQMMRNGMILLRREFGEYVVVEGGARGADSWARKIAGELGLAVETFSAQWSLYGRRAGPIRNRQMLDTKPDLVVAFHENLIASKGTRDCVEESRRRAIPVRMFPK